MSNESQTRIESVVEAGANILVGFPLNYAANLAILPFWWDASNPYSSAFIVGLWFTVVSLLRQFLLRRYFNEKRFSRELTDRFMTWWRGVTT